LRKGVELCAPILLEPLFKFEVLTPTEHTGAVLNQLSARRARIDGVESRSGNTERIVGEVPLAGMFGYVTDLRSVTQGRGSFSMEFQRYGPAE
jgi:elongation factor G